MKDCKPGKIRNPKTNRCASPSRISKQENELHPDIQREDGRCVHISNLSKLTITELKKVVCEHQLVTSPRATKKKLIDNILVHLGVEVAEVEHQCNVGYELNPTTNRCRKSCNKSQTRHPKTQRCRRKI